ncbi:MAG: SAP domain-containing protein [Nitrosarchaeum sp.]|nr:SAP domain-containing protein [Nitrosarchaeum sp.]
MNFFKRFFGKENINKIKIDYQPMDLNKEEIELTIWDYQMTFLAGLHNMQKKSLKSLVDWYEQFAINSDNEIEYFINNGLIRISEDYEVANKIMTLVELKKELNELSLSLKGNKPELIARLISSNDNNFISKIKENIYYIITPLGWDMINESKINTNKKIKRIEKYIEELFVEGLIEKALQIIIKVLSNCPYKGGGIGVDYTKGFDENQSGIVNNILQSTYLKNNINLNEEENNKLRAIIVTHYLLSLKSIHSSSIEEKIIEFKENFRCSIIIDKLLQDITEPEDINYTEIYKDCARIFYNSAVHEAVNNYNLSTYLKDPVYNDYSIINIFPGNTSCNLCKGIITKYDKSNPSSIPKLPKYPGCLCWYSPE